MAAICRNCGAELPAGAGRCPTCLAVVKPPGFFQKLFGGFKVNLVVNPGTTSPGKSSVTFKTTVQRTYKIRDAATGEMKEYHSLEEMPEQYRKQLSRALGGQAVTKQQMTFTGPDGVTHTYHSLDELPPEIRALVERAENDR